MPETGLPQAGLPLYHPMPMLLLSPSSSSSQAQRGAKAIPSARLGVSHWESLPPLATVFSYNCFIKTKRYFSFFYERFF